MDDRRRANEKEFGPILAQQAAVVAYCRRRGSQDPEGIAAETLSIAWSQREKLNPDRSLPWLLATARNLLFDEYRARKKSVPMEPEQVTKLDRRQTPDFEVESLDPDLDRALDRLSPADREAILLIAWEELTPVEAARSVGVSAAAFRVRLHRARRRLKTSLEQSSAMPTGCNETQLQENT